MEGWEHFYHMGVNDLAVDRARNLIAEESGIKEGQIFQEALDGYHKTIDDKHKEYRIIMVLGNNETKKIQCHDCYVSLLNDPSNHKFEVTMKSKNVTDLVEGNSNMEACNKVKGRYGNDAKIFDLQLKEKILYNFAIIRGKGETGIYRIKNGKAEEIGHFNM